MKKKTQRFWGVLLCVSVLLCGFAAEPAHGASKKINQFTDIGYDLGGMYTEYLDYALEHDFVFGTSESRFSPNRRITWGEMVTILGRVHESVSGKKLPYTAGKRFYSPYISWAKSSGLLKNIETAVGFAEQSVTREQAAILLCNYLDFFGLWREFPVRSETAYRDLGEASPAGKEAIGRLEGFQVFIALNPHNRWKELLYPQKPITRQEAVGMLVRFYQKLTCPIDRETRRVKYQFYLKYDNYYGALEERLQSPVDIRKIVFLTSFREYNEYLSGLPKKEIRTDGEEYYPFFTDEGTEFAYAEQKMEGIPLAIDEQLFENCNIAALWVSPSVYESEEGELACEISENTGSFVYVSDPVQEYSAGGYPSLVYSLYLVAVPKAVTQGTWERYHWVQDYWVDTTGYFEEG